MSAIDKLFGKVKKKVNKTKPSKIPKDKKATPPKKKELTEDQKEDNVLNKAIKLTQKKKPLSERQLRFIHFHLLGHSGKDSAIKAKYSEKSAACIAVELLNQKAVRTEIKRRVKAVIARADDKIAHMIKQLYICSYYNPLDIVDEEGSLRGDRESLGDLAYAITGIETKLNSKSDSYTVIKLADKKSSREQLGKYLQMFTDKVELTGGLTLNIGKPPEMAPQPAAESAIEADSEN